VGGAGVILSRDGHSYLLETEIDTDEFLDKRGDPIPVLAIALPLYQGVMIGGNEHNAKSWVRGTGLTATWEVSDPECKHINPQYLISSVFCPKGIKDNLRFTFRDIARTTDTRTMIGAMITQAACGNTVPVLSSENIATVAASTQSFCFVWVARTRMGGTHLNYYVIDETPLVEPDASTIDYLTYLMAAISMNSVRYAVEWLRLQPTLGNTAWKRIWAISNSERTRINCILDAVVAERLGLSWDELKWVLAQCDYGVKELSEKAHKLHSKGFWRVDRELDPSQRQTVLTLVAYHDTFQKTDKQKLHQQNNGEGWQLPESIDLGEYGLGDGSSGRVDVRSRFGARYYSWQESQSVEESWRECHLHARNLLGPSGYASLLAELQSPPSSELAPESPQPDGISAGPSGPTASEPPANGPPANGPTASVSGQSAKKPVGMAESFDPDTFTLSSDPVPKKRKKR
jgi:hypothetical protein